MIIPTFNRRELLAEALESALKQTHANLEVIVVDDGSTDGTRQYVESLASEKVKYFYQENRGYPGAVRNVGLREAQGEFVAFLDSDDAWLPTKIATQLAAFSADRNLDLVATDYYDFPPQAKQPALGLVHPEIVTFRDLLKGCRIQNSSVVIRKEVVDAIGFQDENLRTCEDYEYWLRILRRKDRSGVILAAPLSLYRLHAGNIGLQDVEQCDRLHAVKTKYREYDEGYVDSLLAELKSLKVLRQAQLDLDAEETPFLQLLKRRGMRPTDRLRLVRYQMRRLREKRK